MTLSICYMCVIRHVIPTRLAARCLNTILVIYSLNPRLYHSSLSGKFVHKKDCDNSPPLKKCTFIKSYPQPKCDFFDKNQQNRYLSRKNIVTPATTDVSRASPSTEPSVRKTAYLASGLRPIEMMLP